MKRFKKIAATALALVMLSCSLPLTASAAEELSVDYDFANGKPGYAQGTVTVTAEGESSGNYYLYWADDSSALDGYYEIANLDVSGGKGEFTFLENIAIPADATKLIAIKSDSEPTDKTVENASLVYDIPENKLSRHKSDEKTLSFEALSDTQIDEQSAPFYTYSIEHFAKALEDAADRKVDFITTSGDCINNYANGTSKEWQTFQKLIADSSYTNPIYETNGNHSMKSDRAYGIEAYITATGLGVDSEALGDKPWYEITAKNGDHFLFVALETSDAVGNNDEFSAEQLDWLESTIDKYYNDGHHIFVFEHAFFHGYGPGDDKEQHYYSGGLHTTDEYPGNKRLKEIFDKYNEVFLYTGHSHLDFEYNWNYDNENGQTANMFHIPATACTTHVTDGELDYKMDENASQCYIVDCYDDMVTSNGLNIVDNKIYPQYTYIVDTSEYTHEPVTTAPVETEEPTTESSQMIDIQIENATAYLYDAGAALYFYNNDSGNYYEVDSETGIAQVPENALNLTLYRCDGEWGGGNKTDSVTTYWNKYGPLKREPDRRIFYVKSSSVYQWKDGEVVYPSEDTEPSEITGGSEETTNSEEETTPSVEVTVYWAIPSDYTDSGYTYRMNIKALDGSYPHGARILSDTGLTYNGMAVYSYTFPSDYVEEYDSMGIQRIQMQGAESSSTSAKVYFQYVFQDKTYTISELGGKILVSADSAPEGSVSADVGMWLDYASQGATEPSETSGEQPSSTETAPSEEPSSESAEPENLVELQVIDNTSSGWVYTFATLYLYDVDTGLHYEVADEKVKIPETAVNLVLYRCEKEWGKGNKTDSVTTYWNKWELTPRVEGLDIICLSGDGQSAWLSSQSYEPEQDAAYYLVGYFDKEDYEGRDYEFDENGRLSMTFKEDSYVYVLSSSNTSYWTNGWLGTDVKEATLYRASSLSNGDKLSVASGKVEFKLTVNDDGTLTLSYEYEPIAYDGEELSEIYDVKLGDVDLSGTVDVKDATLIQQYVVELKELTKEQKYAADVFGDETMSVKNATLIQKYVVEEISYFPADDRNEPDISTLAKLCDECADTLYRDYRYASFAAYSTLKTQYFKYKDADLEALDEDTAAAAYAELSDAYNNFNAMKANNNVVTVYFCDYSAWSSVKAYISNSETGKGINTLETAQGISKIDIMPSGAKIYEVTVDRSKWDKIVFTDGDSQRTVELDIPEKNYIGFFMPDSSTDENGCCLVSKFKYTPDR